MLLSVFAKAFRTPDLRRKIFFTLSIMAIFRFALWPCTNPRRFLPWARYFLGVYSLSTQYALPAGLLTGQLMRFQAVGLDPVDGWFRTNCVSAQF